MRIFTLAQLVDNVSRIVQALNEEDGILLTNNDGTIIGVLVQREEYALLTEIATRAEAPDTFLPLPGRSAADRSPRKTVPFERVFPE